MSRRAIVVDDELITCNLIKEVLCSVGMDTTAMTVSSEAAGQLRDEKFDIILLGFRMPPPDGPQLARDIRAAGYNRSTPIIMISGDQQTSAVLRSFEAGANFFLYKPIDKARLLKLVRTTQGSVEHERRRFRRIPHSSKIHLKSETESIEAQTIDISLGGALVRAARLLHVPSAVHISLHLAQDASPVVGTASVLRSISPDKMGIQFDRLSLSESARLQEFLLPLISAE